MTEPTYKRHWPEFVSKLEARMEKGYVEYGDQSFDRTVLELMSEVEEELLDQCVWSFIANVRLRRLRSQVLAIYEALGKLGEPTV